MFRSLSAFDKLLDKATSHLRLEPDWPTILQINDLIRQGDVQPKHVLASIKKKLLNTNPHVAMFALIVLESCVKNCGSLIHDEIGTKAYMEQLRELVKTSPHDNVKTKILELIQAWAFAFRNSPKYRAVQDTMNIMKAEDYKFPILKESDAMFSADTAPEWAEGECCNRCRTQFTMLLRKHHCRACGQVFCFQCSSRSCTLPKFGIEKEVRVCDACYIKLNRPTPATKQTSAEELPAEYLTSSLAQQNQAPPPRKSEDELREEEELQLALALSQSEAEQKVMQKSGKSVVTPTTGAKTYSPTPMNRETSSPPIDDVDPDLARYLNRSYWEGRDSNESSPSAPTNTSSNINLATTKQTVEVEQNGVASDSEMEEFVRDLKSQVEIFVNRMKSNSSRGRSIDNDSSVQKLFNNITAMHSKLLHYIQQQDDNRVYYEGLQDKLAQVKDARAALDALRDEHREKLRREAEMAERQRQHQMAQKLDIMRQKKQEYLQYQRQLTLQRIQEQEREMQMRQEQQKQQYLMGSQYGSMGYIPPGGYDSLPSGGYAMPSGSIPPGYPHYPPQGMPGMMMPPHPHPPQNYMTHQPGAPPMMRPLMGQMMPPIGSIPPQSIGSIPPHSLGTISQNTSPAHLPGPSGVPSQHSGSHNQMPGSQGQVQIQPGPPQGQIHGHQGHIPGYQAQMTNQQGPLPSVHGPLPTAQVQIPIANTQPQLPGNLPNQPQSAAVGHMPNQSHTAHQLPTIQMIPGAPMSPTSNVPMSHNMMPPMGPNQNQPYQTQPPAPAQEQTAELISFD